MMIVSNNNYSQQNFTANWSTLRKAAAKRQVNKYITEIIPHEVAFNINKGFNTAMAVFPLIAPIQSIITKDFSSLGSNMFSTAVAWSFASDIKKLHKAAIKNSAVLAKRLESMGFTEKERMSAVKKFMLKTGCFIQSPVFVATQKESVKALANGVNILAK